MKMEIKIILNVNIMDVNHSATRLRTLREWISRVVTQLKKVFIEIKTSYMENYLGKYSIFGVWI